MPPSPWLSARHDVPEVFHADHQDEGPEDEGKDAQDARLRAAAGGQVRDAFPHRVQRARADVAEDDAERAEAERAFDGAAEVGGGMAGHDRWAVLQAACQRQAVSLNIGAAGP